MTHLRGTRAAYHQLSNDVRQLRRLRSARAGGLAVNLLPAIASRLSAVDWPAVLVLVALFVLPAVAEAVAGWVL